MPATIREVAIAAGVSQTAVSLAFRQDSRISDATRSKVLAAARRLNYVPNLAARRLRQGRSHTIGLVVADITNPFYALITGQAQALAHAHGYQILVVDTAWDGARELAAVEHLVQARVQGALVCFSERAPESVRLLQRYSLPVVALDTRPPGYGGAYVANDLRCAGRLAARHLLSVGCRRPVLALPGGQDGRFSAFRDIRAGFGRALARSGVEFAERHVVPAEMSVTGGMAAFDLLRRTVPDADGLLCANDLCALGVMEAADAAGVRVGPDLALMGIDDLEVGRLGRISLTSISQPYRRLAETAARALLDAVEHGRPPDIRLKLKPHLTPRASTRRSP